MYKIISTFTGGGGLDIGFHGGFKFLKKKYNKLNFKTSVSLDLNAFSCNTITADKKYFKDTKVYNENIIDFDYKTIKNDNFDVLLGGFPCVTFSAAGNRKGITDDINGKLYESYANYVEYFRPKVFLAENVKGMLSANKGEAIKIIKERFEDTGYKLKIYSVNFANFGVPQLRERVLFIGVREDIETEFIAPEFTNLGGHITVLEAFQDINTSCVNHNFMNQQASTTEKLKAIPEGGNFKDLPEHLSVKAMMSNIYRKLDRNKPAYTVIASGGGGTWTYHYEEPRALTNRERARLQSFPDNFIFEGSNTEVRRQIGNAVPPVGIYSFAKNIQAVLDGVQLKENDNCIKEYDTETRKLKK